MVRPRCVNAGTSGCPRLSRLKKYAEWEFCAKCLKERDGKIVMMNSGERRWRLQCVNAKNAMGVLLKCRGEVRKGSAGEALKMCSACFRRRHGEQTETQAKRALAEKEARKRRKDEREQTVKERPDAVELDVLTVRSNFARLTFHGEKSTHVERNGLLCGLTISRTPTLSVDV